MEFERRMEVVARSAHDGTVVAAKVAGTVAETDRKAVVVHAETAIGIGKAFAVERFAPSVAQE